MLKLTATSSQLPDEGALILTIAGGKLGPDGIKLDQRTGGTIKRAMAAAEFTGGKGKVLEILAPSKTELTRLILVGVGDAKDADEAAFMLAGGSAIGALGNGREKLATVWIDFGKGVKLDQAEAAAHFAYGARLRSYRFDKYRTKLKPEQKPALKTLAVAASAAAFKSAFAPLDKIADGVFLTRDLVTEPPNVLYPETLAAQCKELEKLGITVKILDEPAMEKLGMGSLLCVGYGSAHPSRLVIMQWQGDKAAKDKRPVAFVGKGVTFDTGGISLKPGAGMWDMKYDMAGAGAVIGAMKALAGRKAKANIVAVVGLAENMVDAKSVRPGDVVTSMSGQTIEVLNTDAEGRLVLADAVWYVQETYKPRAVIDIATLTGASRVALGANQYAALFANDAKLKAQIEKASEAVEERVWELPMNEAFDREIDSPIADMKNISEGGAGGTIIGAQFIARFVKKDTVWAHIDIAPMAWSTKDKATAPRGATGYGVRLLDRLIADNYEA